MLKNFLYLNSQSVDSYLSSLEDGLRASAEDTITKNQVQEPVEGIHGGGEAGLHQVNSRVDTPESRFERLQRLASEQSQATGWTVIPDDDADLASVRTGTIVEIRCDVYVPEAVRALSSTSGLGDMINMMELFGNSADAFGLDKLQLPPKSQIEAMKSISGVLGSDLIAVGEHDESGRRVAGKLIDKYRNADIDGLATVVGKVTSYWGENRWKSLLALPGLNLVSREKRRELEAKKPEKDQQGQYLEGPAYMLDVIAIYR
ncbi:DUF6414 family protein [Paenarthrobacter nitroguajacolicus]|uniref:DUF6414 family protein n=1 Tax=Paenarthrobacter nitroguajacolicus TaxID=211146 RepID=UPI00248BEB39|nr:hypothetical protein [Paenarthrobacter nitroguajacolicus]MDI2036825.1 hypothetical protein [Paenarthrobacter nitroguajacolicus]